MNLILSGVDKIVMGMLKNVFLGFNPKLVGGGGGPGVLNFQSKFWQHFWVPKTTRNAKKHTYNK